ncbi:MAG: amidohydrolase [Firmicutes bacterium]|nr:amidohydrolase [Bacillota bacterium]
MVVDVHFHQLPAAFLADVAAGRVAGVAEVALADGRRALAFPGRAPVPLPPGIADLEGAIAHLDAVGHDRALVTPWASALGDTLAAPEAVDYCRRLNAAMAEAVGASGGRLAALAVVPTTAPDEVAAVLAEALGMGLRGAFLATHMADDPLDAPRLEAVWRAAEEMDAPVYLHPVNVVETRLERFNLANLLGNPMDTSIAACALMFGGVLDRHPRLRVVLSHGGGTLPYGVGRLDQGYRARRGGPLGSAHPPSDYLRRFYYDAVVYRAASLRFLVESVGADRVMLGTDYPFDMEMPEPARTVAEAVPEGPEREMVLAGTARALWRWP